MITASMITVERDPAYLADTLDNLLRSDLATSKALEVLVLCDSGPGTEYAKSVRDGLGTLEGLVLITGPDGNKAVCSTDNVVRALVSATMFNSEWVMFLEDDIDVCGDFFSSAHLWLDKYARKNRRVYSFGCPYDFIADMHTRGIEEYDYPINDFYGTQCFAIRRNDALSLAKYLSNHQYDRAEDGSAYDLLMADWARITYPEIEHFLACVPSLVQHTGMTSCIRQRQNIHTFTSFPGRDFSLVDRQGVHYA